MFAFGEDIFLTRVAPDGNFDLLSMDFNYYLLILIVIVIAVVLYVIQFVAQQREAKNRFFMTK